MKNKRVAITGATGFIGANLVHRLCREGYDVYALVRPEADLWRLQHCLHSVHLATCSLEDPQALELLLTDMRPQILYHLAFPPGYPSSREAQLKMLHSGTVETLNILQAAQKSGVEIFINSGSSTEYGPYPIPMREDLPLKPTTFRGFVKASQYLACVYMARSSGFPVLTMRLFSIFGAWESGKRLIPTLALAFLRELPVRLTEPGIVRDLLFIDDAVDALLAAPYARFEPGEVVNIGSGRQHRIDEVVEIFQEVAGKRLTLHPGEYPRQPADTNHWQADIQRAKTLLGWQPRYTLADGLRKTLEWFSSHQQFYP